MNAKELIKRHEGEMLKPYVDTVGKVTIGVGRNLTDNGITADESDRLLEHDLQNSWDECAKYPWFLGLSETRKAACLDLQFNVGPTRFRGFVKFISAMAAQDFNAAAEELVDSNWYKQVGRRGHELEDLIRNQRWPA